jgi:hypothetical protein
VIYSTVRLIKESVVTIEIRGTEAGCDLTLTLEMNPKWADYASRTEAGWTKMLNALAQVLTPKSINGR